MFTNSEKSMRVWNNAAKRKTVFKWWINRVNFIGPVRHFKYLKEFTQL